MGSVLLDFPNLSKFMFQEKLFGNDLQKNNNHVQTKQNIF